MSTLKTVLGFSAGAAALAASSMLTAGPTAPPSGPVASTYKTLADVEPRRPVQSLAGNEQALYVIDQPGSYYLTGNISGANGKDGILVTASNVTIDLAGFTLAGVAGSLNGIEVLANTPAYASISVLNGTITAWGNTGLMAAAATNGRAERLTVTNCGSSPFGLAGGTGIYFGGNATVTNCQTNSNAGAGIYTGVRSSVTDCTAAGNTLPGIYVDDGSKVVGCDASANGSQGIGSHEGTLFSRCTAHQNNGDGFYTVGNCTIESCTSLGNTQAGFEFGRSTNLVNCSAARNLTHGFQGNQFGNMITTCTSSQNNGDGFRVQDQSTVTGCTATWNGPTNGTAAGIHAVGQANRLDSNKVDNNNIGIRADGQGNFIVRNTAAYNPTRTQIAANNDSAQWIVVPGTNFVSTDPWANYGH